MHCLHSPSRKLYSCLFIIWLLLLCQSVSAQVLDLGAKPQNDKLWDKTFGGEFSDELATMQPTSDGGYILGGTSYSRMGGDKSDSARGAGDYWIVKVDAAGNKQWDKTYGGTGGESCHALQQTSDGGYIIGGSSGSGISGDKTQASKGATDFWIVKTDANGIKQWDSSIGGLYNDNLFSLEQTKDGGYILGGWSSSPVSGDKSQPSYSLDYWVIKLDTAGDKEWDTTLNGNNTDVLRKLKQTKDGGFLLCGESDSGIGHAKTQASRGGYDIWAIKLDGSGNKIWDRTLGGDNFDGATTISETANGSILIGGSSSSNKGGDKSQPCLGSSDFWLVLLDANGTKITDKTLGGSANDAIRSAIQTADGGYLLVGVSYSRESDDKSQPSRGNADFWIIKLDVFAYKVWDKTFGGSDSEFLQSVHQTKDGYMLGGYSSSFDGDKTSGYRGAYDYWLVKLGTKPPVAVPKINPEAVVFPNPNQGSFTLQLNEVVWPEVEVEVYSALGKKVFNKTFQVKDKKIYKTITLPVASGVYLAKIKIGSPVLTEQTIITKVIVE